MEPTATTKDNGTAFMIAAFITGLGIGALAGILITVWIVENR